MSKHRLKDNKGRDWQIGYDNPCGGFYALRFLSDEEAERTEEECDVLIGFGTGVNLETLDKECRRHGLELDEKMLVELFHDETRERRELSPLQQRMRAIFEELDTFKYD